MKMWWNLELPREKNGKWIEIIMQSHKIHFDDLLLNGSSQVPRQDQKTLNSSTPLES